MFRKIKMKILERKIEKRDGVDDICYKMMKMWHELNDYKME